MLGGRPNFFNQSNRIMEVANTQTDWYIRGVELNTCNCDWGCPCQFNSMPTSGQCESILAMRIDEGHFNGTKLDGLVWGGVVSWPGAIHEGNGKIQIFGDERATPEQREAIETIALGRASNEGTFLQVISATAPNVLPTIWQPLKFDVDIEGRSGALKVGDLIDASIEPIRNPITNAEKRAQVTFPGGMEFREAEYASGTFRSEADIQLDHADGHAHIANVGWDASGVRL